MQPFVHVAVMHFYMILFIIARTISVSQGNSASEMETFIENMYSNHPDFQIADVYETECISTTNHCRCWRIETSTYQFDFKVEKQNPHEGVSIDYMKRNNTQEKKIIHNMDCFFNGQLHSKDIGLFLASINFCHGLEGMIVVNNSRLFIEPLPIRVSHNTSMNFPRKHVIYQMKDQLTSNKVKDHMIKEPVNDPFKREIYGGTSRHRRSTGYESFLNFHNKVRRRVQLYYLDSYQRERPFISVLYNEKRGVNTFAGTVWIARDDKTNKLLLLNGKDKHVATKNSPSRRSVVVVTSNEQIVSTTPSISNKLEGNTNYIEVMVVADKSVVSFHGRDKVEKYLLTMMNIVAHAFADKSTGVKIKMEIARIVLLDDNNDRGGFSVYSRNPTRTLVSACTYVSTLANEDPNHPDHFDYAIVLTRKSFGPSGYAQLYSMCSKRRSCAIARDEGLTSAFVIAHETGHLLGLDHDGEGEASSCESEGPRGSVMAPIIQARYDRFHWSKCSREVLRENIEYFYCLQNKPVRNKRAYQEVKSPGALYSLDEQCQFNFDKRFSRCKSFSYNPCQILWCSEPSRALYCKTMRGPALEGSKCGEDKHCVKGACVFVDNNTGNNGNNGIENNGGTEIKTTPRSQLINGNWGSWTSWSACSQTCDVGIRERRRSCDSPRPSEKGAPCSGKDFERDVCSSKPCSIMKSFKTKRLEECIRFYGKDWTLYTDDAFQRKLEQPGYRLNCTFQDGFCLWKNDDERKSQIKWEIISGKTPSVNTGPDYDHTTKNGKGKYLYMEASSTTRHSKKEGDVARLTSVKLNVPRLCFAMHYHMYGKQIGSLNVKLIHEDRTESTIWNAKGNLGRAWRFMETSIAKDKPYQIVIEAVRGTHWAGDISVDDITINAGRCANSDEETNPCGISCRSRDARRFKLNTNVTDGMRCSSNPRESNICLKGQCVRFGCDNKFNSRLKLDNCGVCGGKGDGCKQRRGRKEIAPEKDYETLLTLEKGSTFIKLKSTTEGRYYLGLRKSTGTGMYLNTNIEDYHVISGLTFLFRNMGSGTQEILSNGPLPENMDVLVYSYDRKRVAITYEYFAPLNAEPVYQYLVVGWQPCSQTCGFGKQNAKVDCRRVEDKKAVDERFCNNLKKPVYTKVCQNEACPRRTKWNAHEWSRCTQTCGEGQQLRVVSCIDEENKQPVSNSLCDSFKMPQLTRQCNTRACPPEYKWAIEGWGQCTTTCGEGIRTREVLCNDITTNRTASDAKCATEKPSSREPCNIQECETYIYEVSLEGACSKTCGGGIKARIVYCISKASRAIVLNKYCDGPSPPRIAQCNTDACPEFVEKVIEETPCSVTCGSGTKIQRRVCLNKETGKEVDGKNCKDFQLKALVVCTMEKCPIKRLEYTPWSTCSKLCGEGKQIRAAKCMDDQGNEYSLNECETVQPNLLLRSCKENKCSQPAQVKCDFDSRSFCNWKNLKNDQFEWNIGKKTPSFSTGPLKDHTTGKGYFAYIETSRPRQRDEIAFLASPVLTVSHGCLRFWYHMRGSSTGTLRVTLNKKIMFEETGQQGMEWKLAEIDIMPPDTTKTGYRFIFHGIVGHNVYGDIAIDDIIFVEESCSKTTANTKGSSKCREISPYCKHERRVLLCKQSAPYRGLCCETCKSYI